MEKVSESRSRPKVSFIRPAEVQVGWEGAVIIFGENFARDSTALFSGASPKTDYKSDGELEATVTKDAITASAREFTVQVHTPDGGLSQEGVKFVVKRQSS